ncbi:MAG TPA: hypothetical protein VMZ69_07300, partial [Saprospiraceae bacterium]|nr:hypothetical protein [Saprospiraceae bacterium]
MKNILLISTLLFLFIIPGAYSQVTAPAGLRYQAIARDANGNIRSEEKLTVKAELLVLDAGEEIVYAELHKTTSGEFGLLNITIGEGESQKGIFTQIPWDKHVWVRISIKNEKDSEFQLVTTSKLYSVPYAFYAATAGKIADQPAETVDGPDGNGRANIGMNSINWTLTGNYNSQNWNGGNPVLGTTDANDLVIVTRNIPRMVISKDGPIEIMTPVDFNSALNVDGNTTLNGTLTVTNMKA